MAGYLYYVFLICIYKTDNARTVIILLSVAIVSFCLQAYYHQQFSQEQLHNPWVEWVSSLRCSGIEPAALRFRFSNHLDIQFPIFHSFSSIESERRILTKDCGVIDTTRGHHVENCCRWNFYLKLTSCAAPLTAFKIEIAIHSNLTPDRTDETCSIANFSHHPLFVSPVISPFLVNRMTCHVT